MWLRLASSTNTCNKYAIGNIIKVNRENWGINLHASLQYFWRCLTINIITELFYLNTFLVLYKKRHFIFCLHPDASKNVFISMTVGYSYLPIFIEVIASGMYRVDWNITYLGDVQSICCHEMHSLLNMQDTWELWELSSHT